MSVAFAHPVERELAAIFDELGIAWAYEPRTFVLERDEHGNVTESFTPDFYLPEQDMYVECTTM
jgi:hypoxanthine phosphoribosyltransferase